MQDKKFYARSPPEQAGSNVVLKPENKKLLTTKMKGKLR